jgi:hypothetical protein
MSLTSFTSLSCFLPYMFYCSFLPFLSLYSFLISSTFPSCPFMICVPNRPLLLLFASFSVLLNMFLSFLSFPFRPVLCLSLLPLAFPYFSFLTFPHLGGTLGEPFLSCPLFASFTLPVKSLGNFGGTSGGTIPFFSSPFLDLGGALGENFLSPPLLYFTFGDPWGKLGGTPSCPFLPFSLPWGNPFLSFLFLSSLLLILGTVVVPFLAVHWRG